MRLLLESEKQVWQTGEDVIVRLLVLNDSYELVTLDRSLLVGPNPVVIISAGEPWPVLREGRFSEERQNMLVLHPGSLYGRQGLFHFPPGRVTFHGYLLVHTATGLYPEGPSDAKALSVAADPLVLTIE